MTSFAGGHSRKGFFVYYADKFLSAQGVG